METTTANPVLNFVEFFYRNRRRYRNFALRFVQAETVAEQIVDDCLVRLWERREQMEAPTIESYFYVSLKNACLNYLRDRQRQCEIQKQIHDMSYRLRQYDIASLDSLDGAHIFSSEIHDIMQRKLQEMPGRARAIFLDSRFNALTHDQLAEKYDIPKFKVCREIEFVVKILRVALKDYLPTVIVVLTILLCI